MIIIKSKTLLVSCWLFFAVVIFSCSNLISDRLDLPEECERYLFYELDLFDKKIEYLDKKIVSSEKYIALKRLSQDGYELFVLSIGDKSGVFTASSPDRNVSISLDKSEAVKIFNNIVGEKEVSLNSNTSFSSSYHNECAFVRLKNKNIQDAIILNASKKEYAQNRADNIYNQLNIYFGIDELRSIHFPNFREYSLKELSGDREVSYVVIDGIKIPEIELDKEKKPDNGQVEAFRKAIHEDLFFELKKLSR